MKRVLWIGPIIKNEDVGKFYAISPAANKWQTNFITSLQDNGIDVINISYLPEPVFPKGKLCPHYKKKNTLVRSIQAKYINLPKIKNNSLGNSLIKKLKKYGNADFVITYNNYIPHIKAAEFAVKKLNMKWINIVADDRFVEGPHLTVFLSYGYYNKSNISSKIHIDGGLYPITEKYNESRKNVILFSGALNKWTGIENFAEEFVKLSQNKFELHIYGKGDSLLLNKLSVYNNIKIKGFVSDEELEKNMQECYAFVNPRPIDIPGGENNFPSKLLEYLKYGKPIISTKTAGIAPYYDNVLFYYDPQDRTSLESVINKLNNLNDNDLEMYRKKVDDLYSTHNWNSLANLFLDIIKSI